jgi:cyclophilin family peptidyl-prolyl cis-trans isomerase
MASSFFLMKIVPCFPRQLFWLSGVMLTSALLHAQQPSTPEPTQNLAPIERLADDAQRRLFEEADRASGGSSGTPSTDAPQTFPGLYPGSTQKVMTSQKKTTFTAVRGEDPTTWAKDSKHKLAVLEISFGQTRQNVIIKLYPEDAPQTVANFIANVQSGAYKKLAFHRAIESFIIQTGDPLSADEKTRERWGTGGEGKTLPAEIKRTHVVGSVAMGRKSDKSNPTRASNGYQFYFALGNFSSLDNQYTVFAQVVSGLETLQQISKMPVDSNDCPIARIELKDITLRDHTGPLYPAGRGANNSSTVATEGFQEQSVQNEVLTPSQRAANAAGSGGSAVGRFFRNVW